jgi:hypothetical protein
VTDPDNGFFQEVTISPVPSMQSNIFSPLSSAQPGSGWGSD